MNRLIVIVLFHLLTGGSIEDSMGEDGNPSGEPAVPRRRFCRCLMICSRQR